MKHLKWEPRSLRNEKQQQQQQQPPPPPPKKKNKKTKNKKTLQYIPIIEKRPYYVCCQHTQIYQTLHAVLSETTIVTNTMYGPQSFYWQTIKTLIGWMRAVI